MSYSIPYQPAYPQSPPAQAAALPPQAVGAPMQGFGPSQVPAYAPAFAGSPAPAGGQAYAPPVSPVSPVPGPSPAYASPQGEAAQQNPQQAFARHLVSVARTLEQAIPGYQFLISALQDLPKETGTERQPAAQSLKESLKEATFHHFAALGAIRRLLIGEVTADLMLGLALSLNRLLRVHNGARPLLDQVVGSTSSGAQSAAGSLAAHLQAAEAQLHQAAAAVQAAVPPQVWENARQQVSAASQSA